MLFSSKKNKKAFSLEPNPFSSVFYNFLLQFFISYNQQKIKKCFVYLKLVKKNQKILSCCTCLQTIHINCIENKFCITKNMLWNCTFCSFTYPFSSSLDKGFAQLFVLVIQAFFILLITNTLWPHRSVQH